jgi:hypothetical protein
MHKNRFISLCKLFSMASDRKTLFCFRNSIFTVNGIEYNMDALQFKENPIIQRFI